MKKSELVNYLNQLYRFANQEEWDQCGYDLQQDVSQEVSGILVCLDLNAISLNFAIEHRYNVIITHHPLFKNNLEALDDLITNQVNYELFKKLNDNNILHIALHTCFDRDVYGTSYQIAKHIPGLTNLQSLPENPYVLKAELMQPMKVSIFLETLKDTHLFNSLRYLEQQKDWTIKSVAIGAGSCSPYLNEVYFNQIDCFITGDIKWHGYQDAYNAHVVAIDINHDAEQIFIPTIVERLNQLEELNAISIKSLFNTLVIKEFN